MFCLNVALGNTAWRLLFKTEESALSAISLFNVVDFVKVADDFGQSLEAKMSSVHGWMLEDMDQTKMAHVEMALHQERTRVMASKVAATDPALRANAQMQGPGIISPMGNGGFPRN